MNDSEQKWQKLVAAARRTSLPADEPRSPPAGFASRVVAMREAIIGLARVLLWRRWSVTVAILCIIIFVMTFTIYQCTAPHPPLIETPELLPLTP